MIHLLLLSFAGVFVAASSVAAGMLIYRSAALHWAVRLVSGAVVYSTLIFLALLAGWGTLPVLAGLGVGLMGLASIASASTGRKPTRGRRPPWFFRILFAIYGLLYAVYVAAPEIQPDAVTYHLGLVSEYVRLGAFPDRVGFYEILPQGIEMLFVPAFALAKHCGAKAVHFVFLSTLIPLVRGLGRELGLTDTQACGAAAFLFLAPVAGVAGTSAYTDAALLCCVASALWMLVLWTRVGATAYLVHAGLAAGFCYAIKPTLGWGTLLAFAYVAWRGRWKCLVLAGVAVLAVAPWVLRATLTADNPVAPFFNSVFPNEFFHTALDGRLASEYSAFRPGFSWWRAPLDYTIFGGNQGVLGVGFLLLPLGFLATGKRWLVLLACLLLLPAILNTGTRFLLPAMLPATLALFAWVPERWVRRVVAVQAVAAFPLLLPFYQKNSDWRLDEPPFAAAAGIEPERRYLMRHIDNYDATEMVQAKTLAGTRVFAMAPIQQAYVDKEVLGFWYSAQADDLVAGLAKAFAQGDFQRDATAPLRRAGYRYLLIATDDDPFGTLGRNMVRYPAEWNLTPVGATATETLFYINPLATK